MKFKYTLLSTIVLVSCISNAAVILEDELVGYARIPGKLEPTDINTTSNLYSGLLYFTEFYDTSSNKLAYLTIGSSESDKLEIIVDPLALHRTSYDLILDKDYNIVPGDKVTVTNINGNIAYELFSKEELTNVTTRSVSIISDNHFLASVDNPMVVYYRGYGGAINCYTNIPKVVVNDHTLTISYSMGNDIGTPIESVEHCYLTFGDVYGTALSIDKAVDDLIHNDYHFKDMYGNISLGTLRQWIMDRYDYKVNRNWSELKATSSVNLDFNRIVFDNDNKIYIDAVKVDETNKYFQLVANNKQIFKVQMGIFENNNDLMIRKFDCNESELTFYMDATITNPRIESISNLTDVVFFEPTQTTDYPTIHNIDGIDCYKVVVSRNEETQGFYRAKGQTESSSKSSLVTFNTDVIFKTGTIFEDDNGGLWRLTVDTNGVLKTIQVSNLISE